MTTLTHSPEREPTIDILRGIAVLGMIVAHAIFFFHTQANNILNGFELYANTIILTLFIFVSGSSYSKMLDSHLHNSSQQKIKHILKYSGYTYLVYLIVSFIEVILTTEIHSQEFIHKISGIICLTAPVNFTEYMILFIFFPLSGIIFRRLYNKIRTSIVFTLCAGILLYTAGVFLYPLTLAYPLNILKEFLAGGNELLRFPILFYYPAYLFGIWWEYQSHRISSQNVNKSHVIALTSTATLLLCIVFISAQYEIPLLSVFTRWPPSIGFLLIGITASEFLSLLAQSIRPESWIRYIYRYITYLGRDALDLWMTHLLLLFTYARFFKTRYDDFGTTLFLVLFTILLSTLFSSIRLTNTISITRIGTISYIPHTHSKFKKRYILLISIIATFLIFSLTQTAPQSLFGEKLPTQPFTSFDQIPENVTATLSSGNTWTIRSGQWKKPIQLTLKTKNSQTRAALSINPSQITFSSNDTILPFQLTKTDHSSLLYELDPSLIPAGKYFINAKITTQNRSIYSNMIPITNSEPLIIAWTFDWEGWDVPDNTLSQISSISTQFGAISFTHFVNPRTFITNEIPDERKNILKQFLLNRVSLGDEVGLHIHMHYDFVQQSGTPVKKSSHWGFMSNEGYDVPSTEYSADDFERVIKTGLSIFENVGLPKPSGYRAGGWFISSLHLERLHALGFLYDASGRDKPEKGAFSIIPWQLSVGKQPYYPDPTNQNSALATPSGILEIPNNGVTTYESSVNEILSRVKTLYPGGVLTTPTTFVITSHPQFAQSEFSKIPPILSYLNTISMSYDQGPVVFGTMNSIYSLWTSQPR